MILDTEVQDLAVASGEDLRLHPNMPLSSSGGSVWESSKQAHAEETKARSFTTTHSCGNLSSPVRAKPHGLLRAGIHLCMGLHLNDLNTSH
jgi:hypothetical protein